MARSLAADTPSVVEKGTSIEEEQINTVLYSNGTISGTLLLTYLIICSLTNDELTVFSIVIEYL